MREGPSGWGCRVGGDPGWQGVDGVRPEAGEIEDGGLWGAEPPAQDKACALFCGR